MSIVGTRPPLISETNLYELHHRARLAIKPGITGMWQVSGRSDITDFEEVVRLDKEYITNWNIGLDIKILFKTDSFLSAGGIRHDQIGGKWVEVAGGAFCTRVIAFKIYRKICALHCTIPSSLCANRPLKRGSRRSKNRCFSCPWMSTVKQSPE